MKVVNLPSTRAEAKANGSRHYFTGKPCSKGHVEIRATGGGACLECMRVRQRERLANDEAYRALHRKSTLEYVRRVLSDPVRKERIRNRERELYSASEERKKKKSEADRARNAREASKARRRENQRRRYREVLASDPEHIEARRIRGREWAKKNTDRCNAKTAHRRALRANAEPPWLSDQQKVEIEVFYNRAKRLTLETGVDHEVDHIVPLNHPLVCGLHVPWNLQVLTAKENRAKANRFEGA